MTKKKNSLKAFGYGILAKERDLKDIFIHISQCFVSSNERSAAGRNSWLKL